MTTTNRIGAYPVTARRKIVWQAASDGNVWHLVKQLSRYTVCGSDTLSFKRVLLSHQRITCPACLANQR